MARVQAGIKVNAASALGALRSLRLGLADRRSILNAMGDRLLKEVNDTFKQQGKHQTPPWPPLKPSTIRRRRKKGVGAKPLQDTGRLRASFIKRIRTKFVFVGSGVKYAPYHEFGSKKKKNRPPQRRMTPTQRRAQKLMETMAQAILARMADKANG